MAKSAGENQKNRREAISLCAQFLTSVFNKIEGRRGLAEFSEVLGQEYNDKHLYANVDFHERLETIKQICEELIEDPDRLKGKGQELYEMTRPVVDAWIMMNMAILPGDTKFYIKDNDSDPTPEHMIALVDAADIDIRREKKNLGNFDLLPVTLTHLCKQWLTMRDEKIARPTPKPQTPSTVINDVLKAQGRLPVITITPQGDGKITLSVQVDPERLPRSQEGEHPLAVLREKAAKEFGLPVAINLDPPTLHWSNCTPDQIAELYPKIVNAFLEKQRSIMARPPTGHDV